MPGQNVHYHLPRHTYLESSLASIPGKTSEKAEVLCITVGTCGDRTR